LIELRIRHMNVDGRISIRRVTLDRQLAVLLMKARMMVLRMGLILILIHSYSRSFVIR